MNSDPAVREGFSRDDRLRKRREFEECYSSGVRVSGRHLQIFLLAGGPPLSPRLGVSVSRRVGDAVTRNRVRRRIREIFRRNRSALPGTGVRVVVNARPSASAAEFSVLRQEYLSSLRRGLPRLAGTP